MKILIVEDDIISLKITKTILKEFGNCSEAVDGEEALEKFKKNLELGNPYNLICLDIMLPNKDGQAVLKEIRKIEDDRGIVTLNRAKIVMVTSLGDSENVTTAFREQCEAYIIKPIIKKDLVQILKNIGLIS